MNDQVDRLPIIERGLDQVENAIVSWRLGKISGEQTWRVIVDAVDRVRPSADSLGAVDRIGQLERALLMAEPWLPAPHKLTVREVLGASTTPPGGQ